MTHALLDELETLTPPPALTRGHGDEAFREVGARWAETLRSLGGLRSHHRVLDVGCGPGRLALALAPWLAECGSYEGFDITPEDIAWCRAEIEPRWPSAHFQLAPVRNAYYNPAGTVSAENFSFPYEDRSFDFVLLTSVFTHLLPAAMGRYLTEVARVLAGGGRCLITYFLTNPDVYAAIGEGRARFTLPHEIADCCRVQYSEQPEKVVAYEEARVRALYERAGLRIIEPIAYGGWSGAFQDPRHSQDFVVAEREQSTE